jgi:hypothetical protein
MECMLCLPLLFAFLSTLLSALLSTSLSAKLSSLRAGNR